MNQISTELLNMLSKALGEFNVKVKQGLTTHDEMKGK